MTAGTVLIVEDNDEERKIYSSLLASAGYEVVVAPDAEYALDLVLRSPPAVIVLDLVLPSIGGLALLQILQGRSWTAAIPVIAMSGRPDLLAEANAEFGVKPMEKPCRPASLLALVNQLCGAGEPALDTKEGGPSLRREPAIQSLKH